MLTAKQVAEYFLTKADPEVGDEISNLKLQKLCYYAQGFSLALYDRPLFSGEIQAWMHGPVIPEIYHCYKENGSKGISAPEGLDFSSYDEDTRELLDEVFDVYGQFSAWKLRNMTHEEAPWIDAWDPDRGASVITHASLGKFFKGRLNG
ncbi:hypothetical protein AD929_15640 [Gluconobacter potus]|uniref:Antitoxin SocA-like Panacea domain-containing protein n=2 Tax=Gluconobacter potus TaxID=2724927 RepID=A0A149QQC1_9PROT|nr:hypothetical protein AD929_15640 [Gluconobacter potus]